MKMLKIFQDKISPESFGMHGSVTVVGEKFFMLASRTRGFLVIISTLVTEVGRVERSQLEKETAYIQLLEWMEKELPDREHAKLGVSSSEGEAWTTR